MNMELIGKLNKIISFFLFALDIFSKYAWFLLLKDKKGTSITNALKKVLD